MKNYVTLINPDVDNLLDGLQLTGVTYRKEETYLSNGEPRGEYQIEAVGTEEGIVPLVTGKAVKERFTLLQPEVIERVARNLLSAEAEDGTRLELVKAVCSNYGERVDLQFTFGKEYYSETTGLGKIQPHIYVTIPVWGSIRFALTMVQLYCTNQIPSLVSDPLTEVVVLYHNERITDNVEKVALDLTKVVHSIESQIDMLEQLASYDISNQQFDELVCFLFDVNFMKKSKSLIYKRLLDCYSNAPNAAPGCLLGFLNAVTRYYQVKPYRQSNYTLASLPHNEGYNMSRSCFKLCNKILKHGYEVVML